MWQIFVQPFCHIKWGQTRMFAGYNIFQLYSFAYFYMTHSKRASHKKQWETFHPWTLEEKDQSMRSPDPRSRICWWCNTLNTAWQVRSCLWWLQAEHQIKENPNLVPKNICCLKASNQQLCTGCCSTFCFPLLHNYHKQVHENRNLQKDWPGCHQHVQYVSPRKWFLDNLRWARIWAEHFLHEEFTTPFWALHGQTRSLTCSCLPEQRYLLPTMYTILKKSDIWTWTCQKNGQWTHPKRPCKKASTPLDVCKRDMKRSGMATGLWEEIALDHGRQKLSDLLSKIKRG